ncbi:MAG: polysaccharide deacetylase family protein [Patescibacteria group bacterium]
MSRGVRAALVGLSCSIAVIGAGTIGFHYRNLTLIPRSLHAITHGLPQQNLVKPDQVPRPVQRIVDQPVPILMFHYVRSVSKSDDPMGYSLSIEPTLFANQLDAIKTAGYQTITPTQLALGDIPANSIMLTFDDGYADFYNTALPLLLERNMTATTFVVSGFLNDDNHRYLTREQVRSLADQGFEIGSHTVSHLNLVTADPRRKQDELLISRQVLEQITGKRVIALAYPSGKVDDATAIIADYVGYSIGVTTQSGVALPTANQLLLPRIRVHGGESAADLLTAIERSLIGAPNPTDEEFIDPLSS